jgi:anti-sigma factor RsiW
MQIPALGDMSPFRETCIFRSVASTTGSGDSEICQRTVACLSAWLDGELDSAAGAAVERHLGTCSACRQFAEALLRTVELCRRHRPAIRPKPLTAAARAELSTAWRTAIAHRRQKPDRE